MSVSLIRELTGMALPLPLLEDLTVLEELLAAGLLDGDTTAVVALDTLAVGTLVVMIVMPL